MLGPDWPPRPGQTGPFWTQYCNVRQTTNTDSFYPALKTFWPVIHLTQISTGLIPVLAGALMTPAGNQGPERNLWWGSMQRAGGVRFQSQPVSAFMTGKN